MDYVHWDAAHKKLCLTSTSVAKAIPARPPRVIMLEDSNFHWYLVKPSRQQVMSVALTLIEGRMKRIQEDVLEGPSCIQQVILDHPDVLPSA